MVAGRLAGVQEFCADGGTPLSVLLEEVNRFSHSSNPFIIGPCAHKQNAGLPVDTLDKHCRR